MTASWTASADLLESGLEAVESLFEGRESEGMCGIAGTMGTTFAVARMAGLGTGGRGGIAEDGVVGCVESASDGAWDVAGVSDLVASMEAGGTDVGGEIFAGRGWVSGSGGCSGVDFDSFVGVLWGSSTGKLADCGGGRRRLLLLEGAVGNSDSGTEYQGSCEKVREWFPEAAINTYRRIEGRTQSLRRESRRRRRSRGWSERQRMHCSFGRRRRVDALLRPHRTVVRGHMMRRTRRH